MLIHCNSLLEPPVLKQQDGCTSFIKVGVEYLHERMHIEALKELAWTIDKCVALAYY